MPKSIDEQIKYCDKKIEDYKKKKKILQIKKAEQILKKKNITDKKDVLTAVKQGLSTEDIINNINKKTLP